MSDVVCFGDDSGVNVKCSCFSVALVCFKRLSGYPLLKHGASLLGEVRRLLGWESGELKYRRVERRAKRLGISVTRLVSLVVAGSVASGSLRAHSRGEPLEERVGALRRLLNVLGLEKPLLVLDHGLIPGSESRASRMLGLRVRFASSGSTPGIQLGDLLAGACYHGVWCSVDECGEEERVG